MTDITTDWTQLREFAGVELEQSFALSWAVESATLSIDVDLCLNRNHSLYEKPRPAEKACIRPANLVFPELSQIDRDASTGEIAEIVGSILPGRIDSLKRYADGRYVVEGMFGRVSITSGRLILRIKDLSD